MAKVIPIPDRGKGNTAPEPDYPPTFLTLDEACKIIGGTRPISKATYYRNVRRGLLPAPHHPTPHTSRVRLDELVAALALGGDK
jgi:hypothetical protein